ncbi:MAG: galactose oxidase-like domain-containing protein [Granulosicoccaceae bacterium]
MKKSRHLPLVITLAACAVFLIFPPFERGTEESISPKDQGTPETAALQNAPPLTITQYEHNAFVKLAKSGRCVTLPTASRNNDTQLIVGDCWTHTMRHLWFDQEADGYAYQLRLGYSGKCLEPRQELSGAAVVQQTCHRGDFERPEVSGDIQLWNIVGRSDGQFSIIHANSGYAITAVADTDGVDKLQLQDDIASNSQLFYYHNKSDHNSDPQTMGMWGDLIAWPHVPVHAASLYDDTVVTWSSNETRDFVQQVSQSTWSAVFDVATETFVSSDNPTHDMFCAGTSMLEDGSVLASGGNPVAFQTSGFDPQTKTWSALSPMSQQRWYGTNVLTGRGDVLTSFAKGAQETPELYKPIANTWQDLPNADMSAMRDEQDLGNALTANNSASLQWYAFLHTAPDGRIFNSGPLTELHWYETEGQGSVDQAGSAPDQNYEYARQYGSAVMYDVGKLLVSGGSDPRVSGLVDSGDSGQPLSSTATAFVVDINGATPHLETIDDMHTRRSSHNSVIMPTGEVFVVGGTRTGVLFNDTGNAWWPEIWNPDTRQWREVAIQSVARSYHSWALLMRDGRILSGGGGLCGDCPANHPDAQFYYPPYFFTQNGQAATRPAIISADTVATVGSEIAMSTDVEVSQFNLIRLSSVTHSINSDQRFIPLAFERSSSGQYSATLSSNTNILLPGMYWLFAIDSSGTPSVGHTIHIKSLEEHTEPLLSFNSSNNTLELNRGEAISLPIAPQTFDADTLSASAIGLPAGLEIELSSNTIEGQALEEGSGSFLLSISDNTQQKTQRINYSVKASAKSGANSGNSNSESTSGAGVTSGSVGFVFFLLVCCFRVARRPNV